ncbi:12080_t:CDS:1, partial [Gigaspora rosea]
KFDELPVTIEDIRNYMESHDEENKDLFPVTSLKDYPRQWKFLDNSSA